MNLGRVAATTIAQLKMMFRRRITLFWSLVFPMILMTLLGVATSYYVQHLVDSVLVRHEARLLHALGIGMLIIVVIRCLLGALRQYLLAHIGRKRFLLQCTR